MVWEDQGLYFTLALNAIAAVVCIIIAAILHTRESNARVMRPNRPGSTIARFFGNPNITEGADDEVGESRGADAQIYVILLKHSALLFLMGTLVTILLVPICATDDYLNTLAKENDPQSCAGSSQADCTDEEEKGLYCKWETFTATYFNNVTNTTGTVSSTRCSVKEREGLFSFSAQNLTPSEPGVREEWRLYIYGFGIFVFAIMFVINMKRMANALESVIVNAFSKPVRKLPDPDGKPAPPRGTLSSIGARTVMISGLNAEKEAPYFASEEAFYKHFLMREELPPKEKKFDEKGEEIEEEDTHSPALFCPMTQYIDPKTVVLVRDEPKDALSLIAEEKQALEDLKDSVAQTKAEEDPENLPIMKGIACCKKEAVVSDKEHIEEVRKELREKLEEAPTMDYTGVVFFAFDTPAHAYRFVEEYNDAVRGVNDSTSSIAGPKSQIVWLNLGVSSTLGNIRAFLMVIIFVLLCFLWGIPVAFLGSLEKLGTLPGIGPGITFVMAALSVTIRGILTAYLPTIVIAVFNILLPMIIRAFALLGGVKSAQASQALVVSMMFLFMLMSGLVIQAAIQGGLEQLAGLIANPSRDTIFAMILAVCSPTGGYFYAFITTAGTLSAYIRFTDFVPVILSKILVKIAKRQEAYDACFAPRPLDYPVFTGKHLFFFAVGMLFHATIPFIIPFAAIYFLNHFLVERSLIIDSIIPDEAPIVDFAHVLSSVGMMLNMHLIATIAACLFCALKFGWGGLAFSILALILNLFVQSSVRGQLTRVIFPTSRKVEEVQEAFEAGADGAKVDPFNPETDVYRPEYETHKIDENAVAEIEAADYTLTEEWPREQEAPVVVATGGANSEDHKDNYSEPVSEEPKSKPVEPEEEAKASADAQSDKAAEPAARQDDEEL